MSALSRGIVWCKVCHRSRKVNLKDYMDYNTFPMCCNTTTTLDSPEERAQFRRDLERDQRQYYLR
jgi:hypothetical protein